MALLDCGTYSITQSSEPSIHLKQSSPFGAEVICPLFLGPRLMTRIFSTVLTTTPPIDPGWKDPNAPRPFSPV